MKNARIDSFQRLTHMISAVEQIEEFTADCSEEQFLYDKKLSAAVLFQFSIIGEAVIHVEPELLQKYAYPWHKVRAFRNLIAHEYFSIRFEAVWQIVANDIPLLRKTLEMILRQEFPEDGEFR